MEHLEHLMSNMKHGLRGPIFLLPWGGGGKRTSSSITECCPGGWWDSALEFPERTGHARGSFGFSQSLGKDTSISVGRARDVTHAALP